MKSPIQLLSALAVALLCAAPIYAQELITLESGIRIFQQHAEQPLSQETFEGYYGALGRTVPTGGTAAVAASDAHRVSVALSLSGLRYDRSTGDLVTGLGTGATALIANTAVGANKLIGEKWWVDEWIATVVRFENDEIARFPLDERAFREAVASRADGALQVQVLAEVTASAQETSGYAAIVMMSDAAPRHRLVPSQWITKQAKHDTARIRNRHDWARDDKALNKPIRYLVIQVRPIAVRIDLGGGKILAYSAELPAEAGAPVIINPSSDGLAWIAELSRPIEKLSPSRKPSLLERKQLSEVLLEAAEAGDFETVLQALDEGAMPNPKDSYNKTNAVFKVIKKLGASKLNTQERVELLEKMIGYGCDVADRDTVIAAIQTGDRHILTTVIRGGGIARDYDDSSRQVMWNPPIVRAAWDGKTDMVRILLAAGANPDDKCALTVHSYEGRKAEDIAISEGHRETAQLIRDFKRRGRQALAWSGATTQSAPAKKLQAVITAGNLTEFASTTEDVATVAKGTQQATDVQLPAVPAELGFYVFDGAQWVRAASHGGKFQRKGFDPVGAFVAGAKAAQQGKQASAPEIVGSYVVTGTPVVVSKEGFILGVRMKEPLNRNAEYGDGLTLSKVKRKDATTHLLTLVKRDANTGIPIKDDAVPFEAQADGTAAIIRVRSVTGPLVLLDPASNALALNVE